MSDDRAERLRKKRNQAGQKTQGTGESTDDDQQSAESGASESSDDSQGSIKEEQVGTFMYLPSAQQKELSRLYNLLKAEYEYEYEQDFEKNRHFYPLIVQYGIDGLDSLDAFEIQERLSSLEEQY